MYQVGISLAFFLGGLDTTAMLVEGIPDVQCTYEAYRPKEHRLLEVCHLAGGVFFFVGGGRVFFFSIAEIRLQILVALH